MTREEKKNALYCLKVMIDEEVCEECDLYGTTGTDHCEADCVRVAIQALEQEPAGHWIIMSDRYIKCSECGHITKTESPDIYNFCMVCGANMSEGGMI